MKASDLFVKCLENEGVEYVIGVPGEENLHLLESLRKSEKIKLIVTRHEQAAAFMAATYGRLTGKAGVCLSTLGPGATNLITGVAYAQLGGMPLVAITGQKPIKSSKQGRFQILNIVELMEPVTKSAAQIVDGDRIPKMIREAFRLAQEERPGAVHLELPEDVSMEEQDVPIFEVRQPRRPCPDPEALRVAVEMIEGASAPLLLIGSSANRNRTKEALEAFVRKTGVPFSTTQMGNGVLDAASPLNMGVTALSIGDLPHNAVRYSDLIIAVGHDVIEKPPFFMTVEGPRVIHVNFYSASVDEVYFPQHELVGDIAHSIEAMTEALSPQGHWNFSCFQAIKEEIDQLIEGDADSDIWPMSPQRIVADTRKVMPDDGIVALDNGLYKLYFASRYGPRQPNTLLLDNALATMGAGLPSAMMAKLVYPERKVIAVCGDGGFMMNDQELETAIRLKLDLVVLILNDSAYGMIKWKQKAMEMPDWGLDFANPDFVKFAESFGAAGHRVESASMLEPLLRESLQSGGVHLIDVPIQYDGGRGIAVDEINPETCKIA
ncbi:acetolactate synthase large subunit [bacterium]|nr:acetolactate synthase large subunit [bacterium]